MCAALLATAPPAIAATIDVPAGGDLQTAINNAQPGDTIALRAGATYTDNFKLPNKSGSALITISGLANPDAKIEIQGFAVIGGK